MSENDSTESGGVIRILGSEDTDSRSIFDRLRYRRAEISADEFKERLKNFLTSMEEVVRDLPETLGEFKLDQITLTAEISAKGQVSLLGTGGEIAGKGGLTFTLKRGAL
jgi:hypothetical protein